MAFLPDADGGMAIDCRCYGHVNPALLPRQETGARTAEARGGELPCYANEKPADHFRVWRATLSLRCHRGTKTEERTAPSYSTIAAVVP